MKEGGAVVFEETGEELLIRPIPDITDSAVELSKYADPKELLVELIKVREESFR